VYDLLGPSTNFSTKREFFYAGIDLFSNILPTIKLLNHNIKLFKSAGSGHLFFSLVLCTMVYLKLKSYVVLKCGRENGNTFMENCPFAVTL
jgi:hypothetical protein